MSKKKTDEAAPAESPAEESAPEQPEEETPRMITGHDLVKRGIVK